MKKPVFTGAGVAIITPFTSTGEVNYDEFNANRAAVIVIYDKF